MLNRGVRNTRINKHTLNGLERSDGEKKNSEYSHLLVFAFCCKENCSLLILLYIFDTVTKYFPPSPPPPKKKKLSHLTSTAALVFVPVIYLFLPINNTDRESRVRTPQHEKRLYRIGAKKGLALRLIYCYIPHNYVIRQVMPLTCHSENSFLLLSSPVGVGVLFSI